MRENSAIPAQPTPSTPSHTQDRRDLECLACRADALDVLLPAGAQASDDAWYQFDYECRFFRGRERVVLNGAAEVVAEVRTTGIQYPDGSVDTSDDAPTVGISVSVEELTGPEAMELAAALFEAAMEIRRWVAR